MINATQPTPARQQSGSQFTQARTTIQVGGLTISTMSHGDEQLIRLSKDGRSRLFSLEDLEAELVAVLVRRGDIQIRDLELPPGHEWRWFGDCDVLGLSSRLDEAGRERAIAQAGRAYGVLA
jgi:hypothetical protein